jgi:hypothetical protein
MGVADVQYTIDHFKAVFEHFPAVDAELSASQKNSIPHPTLAMHAMRAALSEVICALNICLMACCTFCAMAECSG